MASFGSWVVESVIRFSTNGPEVMARLSRATAGATTQVGRLTGAVDLQTASLLRNQLASEKAALAHTKFMAKLAGAGALVGAAITGIGIDEAAKLQTALLSAKIATGSSGWRGLAAQMSSVTAQSVTTIAQEIAKSASSGLTNPAQLRAAFPQIAKAADVLYLGPKHLDPVQSVGQLSQLAHLFGAYHGKSLATMLNKAVALQYVQPEALNRVLMQGKMFIPLALSAGVSANDLWGQILTMGQTGFLRGRGGAGLAMVIRYLSGATNITAHMSAARRLALYQLGMFDAQGNLKYRSAGGRLELGAAMEHLYRERSHFSPTAFVGTVLNAFGQQGGRYVAAIMRPQVHEQVETNIKRLDAIGTVSRLFSQYMGTFSGKFGLLVTNIRTILTDIFYPLLPAFTSFTAAIGTQLGRLARFLAEHRNIAEIVGVTIIGITTILTIAAASWGIQGLLIARNIAGINASLAALASGTATSSGVIATSTKAVGVSLAALSASIAIFATAAAFIYGIWQSKKHPNMSYAAWTANYGVGPIGSAPYNGPGAMYNAERIDRWDDMSAKQFILAGLHHGAQITQNFYGETKPEDVKNAALEAILHPLNTLRARSGKRSTHSTMPLPLTVAPR